MLFKNPSALKFTLLLIVVFVVASFALAYWSGLEISDSRKSKLEDIAENDSKDGKSLILIDKALSDGVITNNEYDRIISAAKKEGRY